MAYSLPELFGEDGLFVDSSVTTLDGRTHSGHFNGSFESAVGPLSTALASQLVAVPTPPPISIAGYGFDSTGLFTPSQQHFGFVFSERAELIGKGQLALGVSVRHTQFESLDGLDLGAIPATFTHDGFEAGGGKNRRSDNRQCTRPSTDSIHGFLVLRPHGVGGPLGLRAAGPDRPYDHVAGVAPPTGDVG